jgi:acyl-CoA thioesterase
MADGTDEANGLAFARTVFETDRVAGLLDLALAELSAGMARLVMTVDDDKLNAHGTAHGGLLFAFADTAFAVAANTRYQRMVGTECTISYLAPARPGDRLWATARETARQGARAFYDVEIANAEGVVIALFRGQSRAARGALGKN